MSFGFLPRKFQDGEIIYGEGEYVEELYLIHSGIVSLLLLIFVYRLLLDVNQQTAKKCFMKLAKRAI